MTSSSPPTAVIRSIRTSTRRLRAWPPPRESFGLAGVILTASECSDGLPNGGHYAQLLECSRNPDEALSRLAPAGRTIPDQWEVQVQALIQKQARCLLYSTLSDAQVRGALLEPVASVEQAVDDILRQQPGRDDRRSATGTADDRLSLLTER